MAILLASCGGRDNSGYRGPIPGQATATSVPTTFIQTPVAAPTSSGPAIGADTDGNAPGIPVLNGPIVQLDSGLRYIDEETAGGSHPSLIAKAGQNVSVHYTGWLTDGSKFDSSRDRQSPFSFRLGQGQVIRGWDEGVAGMGISGKRRLIIPPHLGYGDAGSGSIPPNSTLIFDVELLQVAN